MSYEPDDELRKRLAYVAGDTESALRRIAAARGEQLDVLSEEVGIRRRWVGPKSETRVASADGVACEHPYWNAVPWR